jgi:epoxyqueuosine reductase QueG
VDEYARLYVPGNDPRWLRRNAMVALGNVGATEAVPVLADISDEHADWAIERIESRS